MWRSFFLAVGTMLIILGVECMLIDSATFAAEAPAAPVQVKNESWFETPPVMQSARKRVVKPPEWIPWSSIATGAVVVLYAMTLPARWGKG
ncbi:hypothetical protein [Aureliella helgolandensis]|uniref:Uncharacterized protein n=1 Tax=Aureliella helgolandensis TaxID=2527968 RepID=A0A518GF43_9BACT|nr:hypothetical protein [Aureliella helgolandensis]QDV27222.1 hypothetical protein Q31a_56100 [Aureliella helgolandensis]